MEIRNLSSSRFDPAYSGPITVMDNGSDIQARDGGILSEQGDKVNVSHDALLLTEALRSAQNAPDIRMGKVESIKARVAGGAYEIDSKRIAANLLREEPGLFMV